MSQNISPIPAGAPIGSLSMSQVTLKLANNTRISRYTALIGASTTAGALSQAALPGGANATGFLGVSLNNVTEPGYTIPNPNDPTSFAGGAAAPSVQGAAMQIQVNGIVPMFSAGAIANGATVSIADQYGRVQQGGGVIVGIALGAAAQANDIVPVSILPDNSIQTVLNLTGQSAAIAATALLTAPPAGKCRITYYHYLSQAATTSSSTQLTIGWTDPNGAAQTATDTAIAGNVLGAFQSGSIIALADGVHNITYAASYASVGATSMQYGLSLSVEGI